MSVDIEGRACIGQVYVVGPPGGVRSQFDRAAGDGKSNVIDLVDYQSAVAGFGDIRIRRTEETSYRATAPGSYVNHSAKIRASVLVSHGQPASDRVLAGQYIDGPVAC